MLVKKYLKLLKAYIQENKNEPTLEECKEALLKETLGADGVSIGLTVLWLEEDIKDKEKRNKKSRKLLIKWLKSEMRPYADFGSFSPFVKDVCHRYFQCRKEHLEKVLNDETRNK